MNRTKQAVAVFASAAAIGVSIPATSAVASTPSHSTSAETTTRMDYPPFPRQSLGWRIYWRWNTTKVIKVAQFSTVAIGAMLGTECGALPNKAATYTCAGAIAGTTWAIVQTFQAAAREGKCVEIRLSYAGIPTSWKRYSC